MMSANDRVTDITDDARAAARFWQRVDLDQGCWNWTGTRDQKGYGRVRFGGKTTGAHRVAYELLVGPIPEELTIDHLCLNKPCINPAHLEPVTNRENVLRGVGITAQLARRNHCANGHPFTPENTYRRSDRGRGCRACDRAKERRRPPRKRDRRAEAERAARLRGGAR